MNEDDPFFKLSNDTNTPAVSNSQQNNNTMVTENSKTNQNNQNSNVSSNDAHPELTDDHLNTFLGSKNQDEHKDEHFDNNQDLHNHPTSELVEDKHPHDDPFHHLENSDTSVFDTWNSLFGSSDAKKVVSTTNIQNTGTNQNNFNSQNQNNFNPQNQNNFNSQNNNFQTTVGNQNPLSSSFFGNNMNQNQMGWNQQGNFGNNLNQNNFNQQGNFGNNFNQNKFGNNFNQGFNPNQQGFNPNQQGFNPNQQGFNPNQQGFNPNQQGFNPNQQGLNPNQQGFNPNMQQNNYQNNWNKLQSGQNFQQNFQNYANNLQGSNFGNSYANSKLFSGNDGVSFMDLLEEKLFDATKERPKVSDDEKNEVKAKLTYLKTLIQRDKNIYKSWGNRSKRWALIFRLLSSTLAALVTVLLGISVTDYMRSWSVDWYINTSALFISAFIAVIGVIQGFFDANELYIKYSDTSNKLEQLFSIIDYLERGIDYMTLNDVNFILVEYNHIIESTHEYEMMVRINNQDSRSRNQGR